MEILSSILDQFGLVLGLGALLAAAILIGVTGDRYSNRPAPHINIPLGVGLLILVASVINARFI